MKNQKLLLLSFRTEREIASVLIIETNNFIATSIIEVISHPMGFEMTKF